MSRPSRAVSLKRFASFISIAILAVLISQHPSVWAAAEAAEPEPQPAAPGSSVSSPGRVQQAPVINRPIPGPVVPPGFFIRAVEKGTRTLVGRPGPGYWQHLTHYEIDATLDPRSGMLSGRETVRFFNRSPDPVPYLLLHLHQNIHAEGVIRDVEAAVTGGMKIERLSVDGIPLFEVNSDDTPGYRVLGTLLRVQLPRPVAEGGEETVSVDWSFEVPQQSSGRMGHSAREVYYIGYWFPKIGVHDDLRGWDADPYTGGAEFYDAFSDYRVAITVPSGWTVMATGNLLNPEEVFSAETIRRVAAAVAADDVVQVATPDDRQQQRVTTYPSSGALTYHFQADSVRDFTFAASDAQNWSATSARVPDRDGDGTDDRVAIHSFWRPERAPLWSEQARYAKHSIEFLSRHTGLSYPWPHMTSVEGDDIIGGGMEFPMMTLIGAYRERGAESLYGVTVHELAHMWTPLIVGSNEKRHAWMDEGFASYLANRGRLDFFDEPGDPEEDSREGYLQVARAEQEGMMMQHGDYYEVGYGTASYAKPATLLVTLRNMLGEEVFWGGVQLYFEEWALKHPSPWDFFNTIERAAGEDLDWFWSSWYYETWQLDQAVGSVSTGPDGTVIVIEDHGFVPMPATVRIDTSAGGTLTREIPVSHWLSGAVEYDLELPASVGDVLSVTIDPDELFPDVHRDNNVWPRATESGGS